MKRSTSELAGSIKSCRTRSLLFALCLALAYAGSTALVTRGETQTGPRDADSFQPEVILGLLELVIDADPDAAGQMLGVLREKIATRELQGERLMEIQPALAQLLEPIHRAGPDHPLYWNSVLLAASWSDPAALKIVQTRAADEQSEPNERLAALTALATADSPAALPPALEMLGERSLDPQFKGRVLETLGDLKQREVAAHLLEHFDQFEPELQPKVIELLTQRPTWSQVLLAHIADNKLPPTVLNTNQVQRLQQSSNAEVRELTRRLWGVVRAERNPKREEVIARMRQVVASRSGDAERGKAVFDRVCGQCHRLHGQGQDVGPDLTDNGRSSLEQLLSNVFDPSLVIGAAYQARIVVTVDGRILTGLVLEESPSRIVLKLQGGKQEVIPAEDVEQVQVSPLSMMPEGLEQQLDEQEIADLFTYLRS